jgi:hypothetical protein
MKTIVKFLLGLVILTSAVSTRAGQVSGHFRSNGTYVAPYYRADYGSLRGYSSSSRNYYYRNPYSAYPSVRVQDYWRTDGTFVAPYFRTPPNHTVTDNLNYRGFGTVRVPRH